MNKEKSTITTEVFLLMPMARFTIHLGRLKEISTIVFFEREKAGEISFSSTYPMEKNLVNIMIVFTTHDQQLQYEKKLLRMAGAFITETESGCALEMLLIFIMMTEV